MQVDYEDEDLKLLSYVPTHTTSRWPENITRAYRQRIQQLEAITDEQSLLALKALRFEKLQDVQSELCSIRIETQYKLMFRFDLHDNKRLVITGAGPFDHQQRSDSHDAGAR